MQQSTRERRKAKAAADAEKESPAAGAESATKEPTEVMQSARARRKAAAAESENDTPENKAPLSAIERARQRRQQKAAEQQQQQQQGDSGSEAAGSETSGSEAAGGNSRRARRKQQLASQAEETEAPAEEAAAGRSIRERLGMRPLSIKAGRPASSPGSTPQPLGEQDSNKGVSDAGDAPAAAAMPRPRAGSMMGGMLRASAFARKLSSMRRSSLHDTEEWPHWPGQAELFEEGEQAVAQLREQFTSMTIHRTDELPHDWRIAHPLVSITVVNGFTGRLVRKSDERRDVTTPNERRGSDGALSDILPILTKPYVLRGATTRLPMWEEELIFKEEFTHFLHPRCYVLFELLDFAPDAPDAGLKPFAWGFIKTISGSMTKPTHANILKPDPLRLQLFHWQKGVRPSAPNQPAVWSQYLAAGRKHYSSTLFVSIRPMQPPQQVTVRFPHRPMAVHHREEGRIPYERLVQETSRPMSSTPAVPGLTIDGGAANTAAVGDGSAPWVAMMTRGTAPCQLPNAPLHAIAAGAFGATAIALSQNGELVAIATAEEGYATIAICDVFSGRRRGTMHAHNRTIHELCWLPDGERLASVSADGTAKVWNPRKVAALEAEEDEEDEADVTLQHPAYVYCVRAQPKGIAAPRAGANGGADGPPQLLVTGSNDHKLRLWDVSGGKGELLATKEGHAARINSVAWPSEASLFSADGAGVIKSWEVVGRLGGGKGADLKLISSIEKKELKGVEINSVTPHPTRKTRLLLQTRKHQLLALDHRNQHFSTRYVGHTCSAYHVRACYSPDGRFVLAGSEDGRLFAWVEETGDMILDGLGVGFSGPLLQISWSPQQHLIAMCGYGPDNPALLYYWDRDTAAADPLFEKAAAVSAAASTQQPSLSASADAALPGRGGAGPGGDTGLLGSSAADRAQQRAVNREARQQRRGNLSGALSAASGDGSLGDAALGSAVGAALSGASALGRQARAAHDSVVHAVEDGANRRKAAAAEARAQIAKS